MTADILPGQLALDDLPSEPVTGATRDKVSLVAHDWLSDEDWRRFTTACLDSVQVLGYVDPNRVRASLTNEYGLVVEPRRYSSFWLRAASKKAGFLVADGWVINDDHASGNAGKPARRYSLRSAA